MLQSIRDKISGWVAGIFLGAITIVFIFWGINFQSTASNFAAKVNGEKLSVDTVLRAWQQRQSQLQQMMRGEIPENMVKQQQQLVMDEFVRRTLLSQRAKELGYRISDAALAEQIVGLPQLQVDGKFSRERYAMLLRQQGSSEQQFEAELRSDLAIGHIQGGIIGSAFVTPQELERRYALEKQEREIDYVVIEAGTFAAQINVTGEQIKAWYDEHKADYMLPETVDLQYVELPRTRAEAAVEVTEAGLKEYYDQVRERFESPERRKASHILITEGDGMNDAAAQKKAAELLAKVQAGGDFAQLAQENSKDPGSAQQGGALDWAQRGTMVGPFEEALFAMNPGEIRGPIKTQFGYHIIRLDQVEASHVRPFEEVRAELEADYRKDRSQAIFYEESQKLADKAFAALTELDSVAKEFNLPLHTISGFTRSGGGELGAEAAVIEAAFSEDVLERGQNSPLVTIGEDRVLVLRDANRKPAEPRPLAEVTPQIESALRARAASEAAQNKGVEALAKLQQGSSWTEVVAGLGLKAAGKRFANRQDANIPRGVIQAAFGVAPAQIAEAKPYYGNVATDDGNYALLAVSNVRSGNVAAETADEHANRRRQVEQQVGSEEFSAYLAEMERTAKIVKNEKVFQQ